MSSKIEDGEKPSFVTIILINLGFFILLFVSALSNFVSPPKLSQEKNRKGYPPLYSKLETFLSFYLYGRVRDVWNYPICSVPGAEVVLRHREFNKGGGILNFRYTGKLKSCVNLASYNYLGFAENSGPGTEYVIQNIYQHGVSTGAPAQFYGSCDLHYELDRLTADFLGVDDAISCGMGFATNTLNLPALVDNGCLVLSDEKNHMSIIVGLKASGAAVKVFRHNDVCHLEELLKQAIYYGQPNRPTHTSWKKILIVVEGVYSMEGTVVRLPEVIALKNKYKAYLYLDEAHSIGAMGKNGRGVIDYLKCNPNDIDVLMGTYTKSFGAVGGYIAGRKELISYLRKHSFISKYPTIMSPPVAAKIISVLNILMGKDGTDVGRKRIDTLARNTQYVRRKIKQMGFITYGCEDSPVIPILSFFYSKIACMIKVLREQYNIASIGVGYPATPFLGGRLRICLSAGHTKEQLDYVLNAISKVGDELGLKYSTRPADDVSVIYEDIDIHI